MKRSLWFVIGCLLWCGGVTAAFADVGNYLVGAGDVLKIAVYDHPDLNATVRVNNDGTILYPLVGTVAVAGISVAHVAERLATALGDGFVVNPQVSVFVEEFRSRKAIIMGQVKNPGSYELTGPSTLLELISKAGGLGPAAGETVSIKRKAAQGGEDTIVTVNLKDLTEKKTGDGDVPIQDGDSVLVAEAGTLYVTGQVNRPNAYRLERETTVIKAITMAGGFTGLAAQRRVKIIRKVKNVEKVIENVSMHEPVMAEDVIVVPESFF